MENSIRLNIDTYPFMLAFEHSTDYETPDTARRTYLDRETGELLWLYESDRDATVYEGISPEDNAELREHIAGRPARYLEIPGLTHDDHHELLHAFLESDWTDDGDMRLIAHLAYNGTIGDWRYQVGEDIYAAFEAFRMDAIQSLAENWLVKNRIMPNWV
jgi:hypothetical protein